MIGYDETYKLEKSIWTEADFDQMGWHDARVHGIAFDPPNFRILLDIDYIFAWVTPAPEVAHYTFWVSPCTIVFDNIHELNIELGSEDIDILDLTRGDSGTPRNAEYVDKSVEWQWCFDTTAGEISFRSVGYTQAVRKAPRHIKSQYFDLDQRGGVNFDLIAFEAMVAP